MSKITAYILDNKHIQTTRVTKGGSKVSLFDAGDAIMKVNRKARLFDNGDTTVIGLEDGLFLELDKKNFLNLYALMNSFAQANDFFNKYVAVDDGGQV
jgi:hypothetical protein